MKNVAYLLLGSNIGDRSLFIENAISELEKKTGVVVSKSALYESAAWPANTEQGNFLNKAICLHTNLSANDLLKEIHSIEEKLGRVRDKKWEARIIDIDILLLNSSTIKLPHLTIPHPYLHERRFTLVPLNEIASEIIHPIFNRTINDLLIYCSDKLPVSVAE